MSAGTRVSARALCPIHSPGAPAGSRMAPREAPAGTEGTALSAAAAEPGAPRAVSHWLRQLGALRPRPPLRQDLDVDVAIVGAGFTGLWTAYELQRREPALRIAVLEREVAGFGASGRNGSWCVGELNAGIGLLSARFGKERALRLHAALRDTVGEVGRGLAEAGVEAGFQRSGVMLAARGAYQLPLLEEQLEEYRAAGLPDEYRWLERDQARDRLSAAGVEAALYTENGASLDPGRAVRGLAQAVERRGAVIHELTPVLRVRPGRPAQLETPAGRVRARVAVLALEAYLCQLPGFRRRVLPVYSLIDLTEPLTPEQRARIRWEGRMCVASMRLTVDYLALTADHRILVGGRGAPYRFGSRMASSTELHQGTHRQLRAMFRSWFPELGDVRFAASWGGAVGMPRDWIPQIEHLPARGIALAYGYTGHGVATSNLAGRVLADLICERQTELTRLPLVGHHSPEWEPEPLRWLGVRLVQRGLSRLDSRGERSGRPLPRRGLVRRLAAH